MLENSKILGDVVCYLAIGEVHTYELLDKEEILVADEEGADVRVHYPVRFLLVKKTRSGLASSYLENSTITTNSSVKRLFSTWALLGDELAIGDVTFKLYPEEFGVEGAVEVSPYLVPRFAFTL